LSFNLQRWALYFYQYLAQRRGFTKILEEQAEKIQKSYEETTNLLRGLLGTISSLVIMTQNL